MIRWGRLISRESYILFKQLVHNILSYMVIFITGKSLLALTTRIFKEYFFSQSPIDQL